METTFTLPFFVQALLISLTGSIASVLYRGYQGRQNNKPPIARFDVWVLIFTSTFAGVIGYFLSDWMFSDHPKVVLAIAGIVATGGMDMLVRLKEMLINVIGSKLGSKPNQNYSAGTTRGSVSSSQRTLPTPVVRYPELDDPTAYDVPQPPEGYGS